MKLYNVVNVYPDTSGSISGSFRTIQEAIAFCEETVNFCKQHSADTSPMFGGPRYVTWLKSKDPRYPYIWYTEDDTPLGVGQVMQIWESELK